MLAIRRILVPTDLSKYSLSALRYGAGLAEKFGAELILLHVVQDLALVLPDAMMPTPLPLPGMDQFLDNARAALDQLVRDEKLDRLKVRTEVRVGSPYGEIVLFAEQERVDLMVIGTHGRSGLSHMLLGSVAEKIIRKSPCPVVTVRHHEEPAPTPPPPAANR